LGSDITVKEQELELDGYIDAELEYKNKPAQAALEAPRKYPAGTSIGIVLILPQPSSIPVETFRTVTTTPQVYWSLRRTQGSRFR
jgi:hypothetical protein